MLLAMTIVVVKIIPLIFQGVERLIFDFPPRSPTPHQLVDIGLGHSQVRHPAEVLFLVQAHFPILNKVDAHVCARVVEWHVIHEPETMDKPCRTVVPLIRGHAASITASATQHHPTTSLVGISWHCNEL